MVSSIAVCIVHGHSHINLTLISVDESEGVYIEKDATSCITKAELKRINRRR